MSFDASCKNCGYKSERYIDESVSLAELIKLLDYEHKQKSPNCQVDVMELLVYVGDPDWSGPTNQDSSLKLSGP